PDWTAPAPARHEWPAARVLPNSSVFRLRISQLTFLGCGVQRLRISFDIRTVGPAAAITVHVTGQLRTYCRGAAQLSLTADTVHEVLEHLERSEQMLYRNICDETGNVRRHLNVFVNSNNVRDLGGVGTTLA